MRTMVVRSSLAACLLVAAFGCATPIPPIEPGSPFAKHPEEWELWQSAEQLDHDLAEANQLSRDTALVAYVGRVAERLIADDLAGTGVELKARVVLDPFRNAFATPNGVVYVNSGLLVALDDEAQLASVLAHEIAHFVHRHSLRQKRLRSRNAQVARAGGLLVGVAAAAAGVISVPLIELGEKAVGSSLDVAALGYSRDLEREADQEGFAYLARAGYDLSQGAGVFARLREELVAEGIEEPVFFGTHPRLAEREASYAEMLAASGGGGGERNAEAYASAIRALLLENARLDLALARPALARAQLERHLAIDPASPDGWYWRAELARRRGGPAAWDEAERHYLQALALAPAHRETLRALGLLHRDRGRDAEAKTWFARYLEADPGAVDRVLVARYLEEARDAP